MKPALEAMRAQIVNVAIAVLFVTAWMGLTVCLQDTPTEADAAQAAAATLADSQHAARTAARSAARAPRIPFSTEESLP